MRSETWRYRLASHVLAEGVVIAGLVGWWMMSRTLPSFVLPSPWTAATTLAGLFVDPVFLKHTLSSTLRVVFSVLLSVLLGGILAALSRRVPILREVIDRRLTPVLSSFPSVGWAILATVWFTPGTGSVMFVQVMILTPFCLINLAQGIDALDAELIEMARSFTRGRWKILSRVLLPLLLPYILSAARIAYGIGWKIALVSELFGAESGLGYLMLRAQVSSDSAMVFATSFAIVLIFVAGEKLVLDPLTRRFAPA